MAGKANYKIRVQDEATQRLRSIDSQMKGMSKSFMDFGKMLAVGGAVYGGVRALTGVLSDAIDKFKVQEQAVAGLDAVIRATGGAAGFTSSELQKMASEMQKMTVYGDEAVIGAQSLMLTFRQISEDVFPRAMNAVADMSSLFGSLDSSAIQLGKALNDPVDGLSALARVGITFSDEQKELIRDFQDVNDLASAQDVILDELENQFGGVAQAMGNTRTGELQRFENAWGDTMESIGRITADTFSGVVTDMTESLEKMTVALNAMGVKAKMSSGFNNLGASEVPKLSDFVTMDANFRNVTDYQGWQRAVREHFGNMGTYGAGGSGGSYWEADEAAIQRFQQAMGAEHLQLNTVEQVQQVIDTLAADTAKIFEEVRGRTVTDIERAALQENEQRTDLLEIYQEMLRLNARQRGQTDFWESGGTEGALTPEVTEVLPQLKNREDLTPSIISRGRVTPSGPGAKTQDAELYDFRPQGPGDPTRRIGGNLQEALAEIEAVRKAGEEAVIAQKELAIQEFQDGIREVQAVVSDWTNLGGGLYSALMDLEEQRHRQAISNLQKELEEFDKTYSSQLQLKRELGEDTEDFEKRSAEKRQEIADALQEKKEEAMIKEFHAQQMMGLADVGRKTAMGIMDVWAEHAGNPAMAIPLTALVGGIGAAQAAVILGQQVPQMAEGGLVLPQPGGRLINVAEKGKPEWIIPLDKAGMSGGVNIYLTIQGPVVGSGGIDELSFQIARSIEKHQRTGRLR